MKKPQAIKLWKANHENTNISHVISSFENKKGYASARTLERYIQADKFFKEKQTSETIADKTGWSLKHINAIRPWWEEEFGTKIVVPPPKQVDLVNHRHELIAVVVPGLDIAVFPPRDLDLAIFWSRPNESGWPIANGILKRQARGRLGIRLFVEEKLEWLYMHQHLDRDPIWHALDSWKQAMIKDLNARFGLLDRIVAETQSRIKLPVLGNLDKSGNENEGLGLYYVYTIYDQVFSRLVGIPLAQKRKDDFTFEPPNVTSLGSYLIVRSNDISLHTLAINMLLDAQISLVEAAEANIARKAHESVISRTALVKQHLDRIRLSVAFPEGSTCDGCRQWVTTWE